MTDCAASLHTGRARAGSRFPDTSWGLVLATRDPQCERRAFAALCECYRTPVLATLRRRGLATPDADDLVQGFFLHLLERGTIARADPARGRFRSFMLGSLRWFLANTLEHQHAAKRLAPQHALGIEHADAELAAHHHAVEDTAFELQFDRAWARTLVSNALDNLRSEYARQGNAHIYDALHGMLDPHGLAPSYASLAARLDSNEGAAKVAVHRLRHRFRAVLRAEIARTVAGAREVDDEMRHLRDVLTIEPAVAFA